MFKANKCIKCKNKIKESFDYCPKCGVDLRDPEKARSDYGLLGKNEINDTPLVGGLGSLGITDKLFTSLFNSLMKNLEKQMSTENAKIQSLPNGFKIKLEMPNKAPPKAKRKPITQEQISRMSGLPKEEAKTQVRRFSDKILYNLTASGVSSPEDVFVSKLETGYEVKAIGKEKVYFNTIPIELPLRGVVLNDKGITLEFTEN